MLILVKSNLIAESCQVVPVIAGVVIHVSKGVGVLQGSRPKSDAPRFLASAVYGLTAACLLALGLPEVLSTLRAPSPAVLSCLKVSAAWLHLTALSLHCASFVEYPHELGCCGLLRRLQGHKEVHRCISWQL